MNAQAPTSTLNEVQKQTLQSEESLYNFFSSGEEKEWYFTQTDTQKQLIAKSGGTVQSVVFATSKQTRIFQRSVYSVLDYIGDVGGLLEGLKLIASTLIAPFSSYNFTALLLKKLFSQPGTVQRDR